MGIGDRLQDWFEERTTVDRDEEEIQPEIERAKGDSVQPNTILKLLDSSETALFDLLDEGEQPHYLLIGSSIDVEGDGAGSESITGWDRDRRIGTAFTTITEQRVLVVASHFRGYDEHTIPYDSITAVNLNKGMLAKRLSLQTRGATYHLSVSNSDSEEAKDAAEYLRQRRRQGTESNSDDDPLDRLGKLKSLHEDGVLTDEEFEEKKASLLDEV